MDALKVAELYRQRWEIETAFQKLEKYFYSEINTLGYPKAALFGFCLALVAFNVYAVVMAALRSAYPDEAMNDKVSDYYIAEEISEAVEKLYYPKQPLKPALAIMHDFYRFSAASVESMRYKHDLRLMWAFVHSLC